MGRFFVCKHGRVPKPYCFKPGCLQLYAETLFCTLLGPFALFYELAFALFCAHLRSFALFCTIFCVRPLLERPRLGIPGNK